MFQVEEDAYKAAKKAGENTSVLEDQGLMGEVKTYLKRMEDGADKVLSLWRRFRSLSIEKYKSTYSRLNISFDEYSGRSQVKEDSMKKAEAISQEKGISEFDDGATIIGFEKFGAKDLKTAIIRNRNGNSDCLLRDVGAAIQRWEMYSFDRSIYVVMTKQILHMQKTIQDYAATRSAIRSSIGPDGTNTFRQNRGDSYYKRHFEILG